VALEFLTKDAAAPVLDELRHDDANAHTAHPQLAAESRQGKAATGCGRLDD
jgi:hypothetical protein